MYIQYTLLPTVSECYKHTPHTHTTTHHTDTHTDTHTHTYIQMHRTYIHLSLSVPTVGSPLHSWGHLQVPHKQAPTPPSDLSLSQPSRYTHTRDTSPPHTTPVFPHPAQHNLKIPADDLITQSAGWRLMWLAAGPC